MIETIKDWAPLIVVVLNLIVLIAIKFNDLRHLDGDVKEIKSLILSHESRISKIEGRLNGK